MAITYDIDADAGIVHVTVVDGLELPDAVKVVNDIVHDPRLRPGFVLLSDSTQMNPVPSLLFLRELLPLAKKLQNAGIEPFYTLVATQLQYGVGRAFAALAEIFSGLTV